MSRIITNPPCGSSGKSDRSAHRYRNAIEITIRIWIETRNRKEPVRQRVPHAFVGLKVVLVQRCRFIAPEYPDLSFRQSSKALSNFLFFGTCARCASGTTSAFASRSQGSE